MTIKTILGMLIGGCLGYLFYRKFKCTDGSCRITSKPFLPIIYGAILGLMISYYFL